VFNAIGSGVLVTPFNNLNKPDFSYDEAAIHLTRTLRKFNDGVPGGSNNELGTSASLTWAFAETPLTLNVNNVPTQLDQVTIAQMEFITRIGTGTTGPSAFSDSANISFSNFASQGGGQAAFTFYNGSGNQLAEITAIMMAMVLTMMMTPSIIKTAANTP